MEGDLVESYLRMSRDELVERADKAKALLKKCSLCPRGCGIDRLMYLTSGRSLPWWASEAPVPSSWPQVSNLSCVLLPELRDKSGGRWHRDRGRELGQDHGLPSEAWMS